MSRFGIKKVKVSKTMGFRNPLMANGLNPRKQHTMRDTVYIREHDPGKS
jgi:hypothetical protein